MDTAIRAVRRPVRALVSHIYHSNRHYHPRVFPSVPTLASLRARRQPTSFIRGPILAAPNNKDILSFGTACRDSSTMAAEPQFAEGTDAEQLRPGLNELVGRGWTLDGDGMGVQKTYHFRTYFKAVSFLNVVASQSASKKHHPTMTVRIGSVDVHWTTHHPRGLSDKDVTLAQHCDEAAEMMGAVDKSLGKNCAPPSIPDPPREPTEPQEPKE